MALTSPALAAAPVAPGAAPAGPAFHLDASSVRPKPSFFDQAGGVRIKFRFTAAAATDVLVRIMRRKRELGRIPVRSAEPGVEHLERWQGLRKSGKPAPDGRYRVVIGPRRGPAALAGRFRFHGYIYPVRGPHSERGPIGEFGVPRSGGRRHEGFDVDAACGTPLAAVRGGRVVDRGYDPVLYGNYVLIKGRKTRRSFFYAHLRKPAAVGIRDRVHTGQRVGAVGRTGNARSTECHLHFEVRRRSEPVDPEPLLRRWDRYS